MYVYVFFFIPSYTYNLCVYTHTVSSIPTRGGARSACCTLTRRGPCARTCACLTHFYYTLYYMILTRRGVSHKMEKNNLYTYNLYINLHTDHMYINLYINLYTYNLYIYTHMQWLGSTLYDTLYYMHTFSDLDLERGASGCVCDDTMSKETY